MIEYLMARPIHDRLVLLLKERKLPHELTKGKFPGIRCPERFKEAVENALDDATQDAAEAATLTD